jgi:hypothetical protein
MDEFAGWLMDTPDLRVPNIAENHIASASMTPAPGSDDAKLEPLLRKVHTKSRRGCYNCKKRRIKVRLIASTSRKAKAYYSVQRIIQHVLNVLDVASNVNGQSFMSTTQKKL